MRKPVLSLALLALAAAGSAQAQTYPARAVTIIVPFAAGGPADITGRIAADQLSKQLGQQFVVENVGGAGGATGATRAARAAPDGYTLLLGHLGTHAASVALNPNLAYNPQTDFEPVGLVGEQPELLVTRKALPPNTLKEFVAYAKANESKLNMAHAGVGSVSYTGCLLLNAAIGIKPTLVPFTGTAPVLNAMLGEQVDYVCDPILGPLPHVRAGKLKALAITSAKRHPALPDVPTSAEGGLPAFNITIFFGLFAPKGTPQSIIDRLVAALDKGLDDEGARKRLTDLGASIPDKDRRGPQPLAALVKSEIARLTPILKAATAK
jgi:tripartite-type tricarboxylate transporter receptor subunit TctC